MTAPKTELRRDLLARRRGLPAETVRDASAAAAARLLALPEWRAARTVALYVALRGEIDPGPALQAADGRRVALPEVQGDGALAFRLYTGPDALVSGAYGIPVPTGAPIPPEAIDLFVIPGVAFDGQGGRLGMGKGFYDRALAGARPDAARVGLAYHWQVLEIVPVEQHDVRMHAVVTDRRVLRPAPPSAI